MKSLLQAKNNQWKNLVNSNLQVDSYEEKIETLEKEVAEQKDEIIKLKSTIEGMTE